MPKKILTICMSAFSTFPASQSSHLCRRNVSFLSSSCVRWIEIAGVGNKVTVTVLGVLTVAGELSPQFESDIKIKLVCCQWKVICLTQLYCVIF